MMKHTQTLDGPTLDRIRRLVAALDSLTHGMTFHTLQSLRPVPEPDEVPLETPDGMIIPGP